MKRKQKIYNEPVGIKDGQLYLVNYTFEDTMHGKPFKGVTGSVLIPVSQEEIDERNTEEYLIDCMEVEYHWEESVKCGAFKGTLKAFIKSWLDSVKYDDGGEFIGHDTSDIRLVPDAVKEKYFKNAATFECVGGGRCFRRGMKFDVVLNKKLLAEIERLEK